MRFATNAQNQGLDEETRSNSAGFPSTVDRRHGYQWCACRRREKGTAWTEMKTAPDHNEKEQKQTVTTNEPVFDFREHDAPPMGRASPIASTPPLSTQPTNAAVVSRVDDILVETGSSGLGWLWDAAFAGSARECSQRNSHPSSRHEPEVGISQE